MKHSNVSDQTPLYLTWDFEKGCDVIYGEGVKIYVTETDKNNGPLYLVQVEQNLEKLRELELTLISMQEEIDQRINQGRLALSVSIEKKHVIDLHKAIQQKNPKKINAIAYHITEKFFDYLEDKEEDQRSYSEIECEDDDEEFEDDDPEDNEE